MTPDPTAHWHTASYDNFVNASLPELLRTRVPLDDYRFERVDDYHVRIELSIASADGTIDLAFDDVPAPDAHGVFFVDAPLEQHGGYRVVIPVPDRFDLQAATIRCVGEQFADDVDARLGEAPDDVDWDRRLAEAWLPITGWLRTFLRTQPTAQLLQNTNWVDRTTHLRRITLLPLVLDASGRVTDVDRLMSPEDAAAVVTPGLVCPIIMPEGPNMGWIVDIARGAEIRRGRLVRIEGADKTDPTLDLGWNASMIPFIEHTDSARLLMGANMVRQWLAVRNTSGRPSVNNAQSLPADLRDSLTDPAGPVPEPALVRTGCECEDPDGWAGFNLLTAFVMWDGDTFEDGIVLSESAADRLAFPRPVDVGDKLSNRHGFKGVVARILPDTEMPALPDGTPADIIVSPTSLVSRMNFGQIREAVMGRIAQAEGGPITVPPFSAPAADEIRARLKQAGLPEDGMEQLTLDGEPLPHRSTVGYVYWGRLLHLARHKLAGIDPPTLLQAFGERQMAALQRLDAAEVVSDILSRADRARSTIPTIDLLTDRLRRAGLSMVRSEDGLTFSLDGSRGHTLAIPVPHPWLPDVELSAIGEGEGDAFNAVLAADERVRRLGNDAPAPLSAAAGERLQRAAAEYLNDLLSADDLRVQARVPDSGRAVAAPGPELRIDQVGLPRELVDRLFDGKIPDDAHVLVHKGVHTTPTSLLALRPVPIDDPVIRMHPVHCPMLDADFDGDQVFVLAVSSPEAVEECVERLSIAGHLRHTDRALETMISRPHAILWGLARLARTKEGRKQIENTAGVPLHDGLRDKRSYVWMMRTVAEREGLSDEGVSKTLGIYGELARLGFASSRGSGVSIHPFLGSDLRLPDPPSGDDPELFAIYRDELIACLDRCDDPDDDDIGTFNTFRFTGTRGSSAQYALYFGAHGTVHGSHETVDIRHGYLEGMTFEETAAHSARIRAAIAAANREMAGLDAPARAAGHAHGVIARARRSAKPGVVFARAADRNETDPLEDFDARMICGLL